MIKIELWYPQRSRTYIVQLIIKHLVSFVTNKTLEQQIWPAKYKPFDRHEVFNCILVI